MQRILDFTKSHPIKAILIVVGVVVLGYVLYVGYLVVWGDFRTPTPASLVPEGPWPEYRPFDCGLYGFTTPVSKAINFTLAEHLAIFIRTCWLP